ncbi:MAG: choice-of-anchor Q domain-containing protein, partial [Chloroflexota bacterium]
NNQTADDGGAIYNRTEESATNHFIISRSTITGNQAGDDGGGIYNIVKDSGNNTLIISDTTISDNSAAQDGGGVNNVLDDTSSNNQVTIQNSTISGNEATLSGGGISNQVKGIAHVTIENSTVSGNATKTSGGGLYNHVYDAGAQSIITLTHTTLVSNTADSGGMNSGDGGGIYTKTSSGATQVIARNSLVALNLDSTPAISGNIHPDGSGDITGASYNLISDTTGISGTLGTGTDLVTNTLILEPLANNGGINTASGEPTYTHALPATSPAVDAIPTANCLVPEDQRVINRPQGAACDFGAF